MRLTLTLTVASIGSLLFGLAFLLAPEWLASLYGIPFDPSVPYPRFFGSSLLGFAALLWLARKVSAGPALRAILVGSLVASVTGLVVAVLQVAEGTGNSLGWAYVVIYLLLAVGFGDFVVRTPPR